jgi:hypothetical protein
LVAAGYQDDVRIAAQVEGLLLGGARCEVESFLEPHGNERSDVRSTIGPDGGDPEELRRFESSTGLVPSRGGCVRVAESLVEFGSGFVHLVQPAALGLVTR